jgi:hypothetical protein
MIASPPALAQPLRQAKNLCVPEHQRKTHRSTCSARQHWEWDTPNAVLLWLPQYIAQNYMILPHHTISACIRRSKLLACVSTYAALHSPTNVHATMLRLHPHSHEGAAQQPHSRALRQQQARSPKCANTTNNASYKQSNQHVDFQS